MQESAVISPAPEDLLALFSDLATMVPSWDPSRPASELTDALKERLSSKPAMKHRGKCMSRRQGQLGRIEEHGKFYTLRVWMDVAGQEKRQHVRIRICPIRKGSPGWLNSSQRQTRAKEIIQSIGANSPERFEAVVNLGASLQNRTFREQAKTFLEGLRTREKPAASSTLESWEGIIDNWLNPMLGDMPLEQIKSGVLKRLVVWMKGGPGPSERQNDGR
jgi:hypothetical protein